MTAIDTSTNSRKTTSDHTVRKRQRLLLPLLLASSLSVPVNAAEPEQLELQDKGLNNLTAATLSYPQGWQVEGELKRNASPYYSVPVIADIKISADDGRQAHLYPNLAFEFDHNAPARIFSPTRGGRMYLGLPASPGNWLLNMIEGNPASGMSEIRLIDEKDDRENTAALHQLYQQVAENTEEFSHAGKQSGDGYEYDIRASIVTLQYQQAGLQLEETLQIFWSYRVNMMQGQPTHGSWTIIRMVSLRGPLESAYLLDQELHGIMESVQYNPDWLQQMNAYWQDPGRLLRKGVEQSTQQKWAATQERLQTRAEIDELIRQGWQRLRQTAEMPRPK